VFDPDSKESRKYKEYLKNKKCLIVDPTKSLRTPIKKIFSDLGVSVQDIFTVNTLLEATETLSSESPHFIVSQSKIDDTKVVETLLPTHLSLRPNRLESGFFLISPENSLASAIAVLELEVDAFIAQPFTLKTILDTILKTLDKKIAPSQYKKKIEGVKEDIHREQLEKALSSVEESFEFSKNPGASYFYQGLINSKLPNKEKQAEESYLKGLDLLPNDYKLLNNLSHIYFEQQKFKDAYELNKKLRDKYPINPNSFPMIVKLAIHTANHQDILDICNFFKELEGLEEYIKNYISASLTICGRYFFSINKNDLGKDCLDQAIEICEKIEVFESIIELLLKRREYSLITKYLDIFNKSTHSKYSDKVTCFNIRMQIENGNLGKAFDLGNELLKKNSELPEAYALMIKVSKQSGKSKSYIDELIRDACKKFPDNKNLFR